MKEYRLTAWPELPPPFNKMAFRRLASDMSQRHLAPAELAARSGLAPAEVQRFLESLARQGLLDEREQGRSGSPALALRAWWRRVRAPLA